MSAPVLVVAAAASALAGFVSLSLGMDRHYADSLGRSRSPGAKRPWLQLGGALGLLAALLASLAVQGAAQGWVLWFGVMTASALCVVGLLAFRARLVPAFGLGMAALAVLAFAGGLWV